MIGIIDCGIGNLSSVKNILDFVGVESVIIDDPHTIKLMDKIILPGVGSFKLAMSSLENKGFITPIKKFAQTEKYILGICLGMQLLANQGTESGLSEGLGLVDGVVDKLDSKNLRLPHVGWNGIKLNESHPIIENVKIKADFYFVHSFAFKTKFSHNVIAYTNYGSDFPSIICNDKKNVIGIQFHPEKSQKQGLKIIENFVNI